MATNARLAAHRWMRPIWLIPNRPLREISLFCGRQSTGICLSTSGNRSCANGFWKSIRNGNRMCMDNANRGSTWGYNLARWAVTSIGGFPYRWKAPKVRCCMCGSMLLSGISRIPKSCFPTNGNCIGKTRIRRWFTLSARTTSYSTALFSLRCWKPRGVIFCRIMCRPMSSWIWKVTRFPLRETGRYGYTSISKSSPANRTCCVMCSRPTLPRRRTTISLGKISKLVTIMNWWLFSAISWIELWCWLINISTGKFPFAVNWPTTTKKH